MNNFVCFGEVLWDVYPDKKKIGGAPLNVALRLHLFGNNVSVISAIGNDELGHKLKCYLLEKGLPIDGIQVHDDYKTGDVQVSLNEKGSATYSIEYPRAWDKVGLNNDLIQKVASADAFVFGSLVTRDEVSKDTLYKLLELAKYKIFDLNLRPPYYSKGILSYLMDKADFIKFNDDELYEVSTFLGSKSKNLEKNIYFISEITDTKTICVTKGEHGAVLLYNEVLYYNSGYQIKVVDTVGAGDSFLGTLISKLLSNLEPQNAIDYACAVGAMVAQNEGANPVLNKSDIKSFIRS
ncbi:carbohydrate kinase [Seonamhaeicola sp. MEBiC1930]|uniref:carbohydrate kinase family protein n=1 Tax=Seonamhaeicola sp. MEBiC01930 TaxID=2976768 RepID=UPI00324DB65B